MDWDHLVGLVSPFVVRVETPGVTGTGFICLHNEDKSWIGVATANHVVTFADQWEQPIRIYCPATQKSVTLSVNERPPRRVVFPDWKTDSAVIFLPNELGLDEHLIPLLPASNCLPIGSSIGWLGFPSVAPFTLCFFAGRVSAVEIAAARAYLIDGVAIHGVSGGPVFYHDPVSDIVYIVGVITEYRANRQPGEVLPGLSVAQDVSHFHSVLESVRNYDDAERRKRELAAQAAAAQQAAQNSLLSQLLRDPPPLQ